MSFFESLHRRTSPRSACKQLAMQGQAALWAVICVAGWAQTPSPSPEAIKKAIQQGQLDHASKLVQQARELAPKDVQIRFMEGVIQAQQGQTDKAMETFRQLTQVQPDLSEAYNNLGVLYASKGRLEESKVFLEKALKTHPSYAAAHRNLSDVQSQLAQQNYAKALLIDPKVKPSPPQLTLLGSIGEDKRPQAALTTPTTPAATRPANVASAPPLAPAVATQASAPTTPLTTPPAASLTKPATAPPVAAAAASSAQAAAGTAPPSAVASAPAKASVAATEPKTKVEVAAAKPAPDVGKADQAAIKLAIANWAKAWSQKDMPRYLATYASSFTPADRMSRSKWESDRRARIVSKKTISVTVNQLNITLHGDKATVRFQQIYESDNFKGNSRKTMEMVKQGPQWLIVRETVN